MSVSDPRPEHLKNLIKSFDVLLLAQHDTSDVSRAPTAAEQYLRLREVLVQCAGVMEREVMKFALAGHKEMSEEAYASLCKSMRTCAAGFASTTKLAAASCSDACREFVLAAARQVLMGARRAVEETAEAIAEGREPRTYVAGEAIEMCQRVSSVPRGNRVAAKRVVMQALMEVQDTVREFTEMMDEAEAGGWPEAAEEGPVEGHGGAALGGAVEGGEEHKREEEVEVEEEDALAALMKELGHNADAQMTRDDVRRGRACVRAMVGTVGALRATAAAVNSLPRGALGEDAVLAWLDGLAACAKRVVAVGTDFGVTLYPEQDPAAMLAQGRLLREAVAALAGVAPSCAHVGAAELERAGAALGEAATALDEAIAVVASDVPTRTEAVPSTEGPSDGGATTV